MVTSCETGPDAWRHQEEIIRTHFPHDHPDFALTEDPVSADVILIGNLRSENDYLKLRALPCCGAGRKNVLCFTTAMTCRVSARDSHLADPLAF